MDFYYRGTWRLDWGLGNPNKTATIIAMLMIAVWGLAYVRKWGFWPAVVLFAGLGICLIHTFSRGGLVAVCAGLGVLLWCVPRPWPVTRVIAVAVALFIMTAAAVYLQAHDRFARGIAKEDRSITNRLKIWKCVPRMMVDAPGGWGRDHANRAYMQWYQSVDSVEAYLNLVNSHFTWMVEMNWFWRFCYLLGWGAIFLLCWPTSHLQWLIVPFAVWLAFAVAAVFTHVAEALWIWVVPTLCLLSALIARAWRKAWPPFLAWGAATGVASVILATFWLIGTASATLPLRYSGKRVILGRDNPRIWIVANPKVMGDNFGKTLRRFLNQQLVQSSAVGVVDSIEEIPAGRQFTVVVSGALSAVELNRLQALLFDSSRVLMLNPTFYPQELGADAKQNQKLVAFFGEFSQSPAISAWSELIAVQRVEVAGDFLPQWPELVFLPAS